MTAVTSERQTIYSLLTNDIQLCLAHYCDLHGPTPLMVTEGLPVPCGRCYNNDRLIDMTRVRSSSTSTGAQTMAMADVLRKTKHDRAQSSAATAEEVKTQRAALLRASNLPPTPSQSVGSSIVPASSTIAVETPPQSPQKPTDGFPATINTTAATNTNNSNTDANTNASRRDASFRRTYDDYVTKRANPCANCALTLPKRQEQKREDPATAVESGTASKSAKSADTKSQSPGPVLRTRAPCARVYGSLVDASPPCSNPQSSHTSDAEEDASPTAPVPPVSLHRRPTLSTSTSQSSTTSRSSAMPHHTHYLDYTSTHEPTVPSTYTIVRASCLRTLSFETLPRRLESAHSTTNPSTTSAIPILPSPALNVCPGYITAPPTPQSAANGGPIFFGDSSAGYTTAYIFRIPDMHARGRKRVYAFMALSTHRERLAMKAFSFISAAFHDLAIWIQELAELEAEREREREEEGSAVTAINANYGNGGFGGRGPHDSGIGLGGGFGGGAFEKNRDRDRDRDTTSFLTGGGRAGYMQRMGMGGSMGPGGFTPKARGLAELVGLPDFFIELHSRFVKLLLELGVVLGT
ncbi:vesicle coat protein [Xylaria nigripes]|nr:vesicle coat protein [Xylaria nigripes]